MCFYPHSASWPRLAQTQSACLTCAGTTTRSRRLPSFTVSWSLRSSKPSRSPSLSPTVTSSPPLDQDSILFRHQNRRTLLATDILFFKYLTLLPFYFVFSCQPFFSGEGEGAVGRGGNLKKKKDFTVLKMESCSIHLVQMEWGRMFNNYIYKATFFQSPICKLSVCFLS